VLMDCQMPEMDGFEATREIRRRERQGPGVGRPGGRVPIIALTASVVRDDWSRCIEAGMDDCLAKPIEIDRLVEVICKHVRTTRADGQDAPPAPAEQPAGTPGAAVRAEPAPEPAPPEARPFDRQALARRGMREPAFLGRVMAKFADKARQDLAALEDAVKLADAAKVGFVAHSLKGAAANLAAEDLRQAAAKMESLGRSGLLGGAEECLERVRQEVSRCLAESPELIAWASASADSRVAAGQPAQTPR